MDKKICINCYATNPPKDTFYTKRKNLYRTRKDIQEHNIKEGKAWCPTVFFDSFAQQIKEIEEKDKELHNFLWEQLRNLFMRDHNFFNKIYPEKIPFYCPYKKAHELFDDVLYINWGK